jgi:hypothetical protein
MPAVGDVKRKCCLTIMATNAKGGVRRIRTLIYLERQAVVYPMQRSRYSARAAARFRLKFCLL